MATTARFAEAMVSNFEKTIRKDSLSFWRCLYGISDRFKLTYATIMMLMDYFTDPQCMSL